MEAKFPATQAALLDAFAALNTLRHAIHADLGSFDTEKPYWPATPYTLADMVAGAESPLLQVAGILMMLQAGDPVMTARYTAPVEVTRG